MASNPVLKAKKYMLRSCAKGNVCACTKAKRILASDMISIHAGSMVTFAEAKKGDHINKLPFKGILLLTDVASTKPPHGSRGHRIFVPKDVVEKHLDGLIGMGINYDQVDLDSHETRHKVGVIEKAWTKGNQVWVSGFVWKKDFPEAVNDLKRGGLGMSMELADVFVRDDQEDVWHLEDFEFTGATILKKSAAAYYGTELVASSVKRAKILTLAAAAVGERKRKGDSMAEKNGTREKAIAAAGENSGQGALLVGAIKGAMSEGLAPLIQELKASNDRMGDLRNDVEELKGLYMIQAAAHEDEEDDEEMTASHHEEDDDEEMSASGKKDNQDDDDDDDSDGEDDDLDAMEDLEKEAADQEPGELNKDAANRGDKTTVTRPDKQREKVSGNIAKGRLQSAAAKGKKPFPGLKSSASIQAAAVHINTLTAQIGQLKRQNKQVVRDMQAMESQYKKEMRNFGRKYEALEAQAEKWSEQVERKSVIPVDVRNLAAKNNVDLHQLQASGEKMSVDAVDKWFRVAESQGIQIEPSRRAGMKTQLYHMGLMESGEIPFGGVN